MVFKVSATILIHIYMLGIINGSLFLLGTGTLIIIQN